jgi:hypothetical protein
MAIGTALVVLVLVALGTWNSYYAQQRNDQYQLVLMGQCVHDGGRMYIDCWENKPPGLAWINAAAIAVGGGAMIGPWLMPGALLLLVLIIVGVIVHRLMGLFAACGVVLIGGVVFTLRLYDAQSVNPDFYSAMFELAAGAIVLAVMARGSQHIVGPVAGSDQKAALERAHEQSTTSAQYTPRHDLLIPVVLGLLAGILWAAAATVKHTGVVGLVAFTIVGIVLQLRQSPQWPQWKRAIIPAWVGFILGLGGVLTALILHGTYLGAWDAAVAFNRNLATWDNVCIALGTWSRAVAGLAPVQLGLWIALVGLIAACRWRSDPGHDWSENRPRLHERDNHPYHAATLLSPALMFALLLWWGGQVVLAMIGPSHSMRYWQATFPPMLLLAAGGCWYIARLYLYLPARSRSPLVLAVGTVALVLGWPLYDHYRVGTASSYLAYSEGDPERVRLREIGEVVAKHVPQGERVYVLAYDAGVYLYADRRPASRYTYPRSARQMEEILSDLESGKAYAVLAPERLPSLFDIRCDETCRSKLEALLQSADSTTSIHGYQMHVYDAGADAPAE